MAHRIEEAHAQQFQQDGLGDDQREVDGDDDAHDVARTGAEAHLGEIGDLGTVEAGLHPFLFGEDQQHEQDDAHTADEGGGGAPEEQSHGQGLHVGEDAGAGGGEA